MPICFIFNYFYPICLLAPSKCCKPPCLCSRADMQHPTTENAGRAELQSSQWLGRATDPLEHRACRSQARVAPRLPAGQLTTSAPAVRGTTVRNPRTCAQPTAVLAAQAGSWPAPLPGLLPESWGQKKEMDPSGNQEIPFYGDRIVDSMGTGLWIICCSPTPPPFFFLINENTPEELSAFFQNFSISLTCSNLHHSSFLVSNCTTALYLCPRTNALVEGMNRNLSVKGASRHPRNWHSCYLHVKGEKRVHDWAQISMSKASHRICKLQLAQWC